MCGGGTRGGRRGDPGGAPRAARVYARGVPGHPRGLSELPQTLRGPPSRPRVSPKMRPSFKIDGFVTDENRFSKDSKSHPELHRASPKASQELPRVPQVASTAPPRVPQGTPKSPWEGGGPPGHPWEDMGADAWGPWGSLGVIGASQGPPVCPQGIKRTPV